MDKRTFRERYEAVGRLTNEFSVNHYLYKGLAAAAVVTALVVTKRAYDR